MAIFNSYVSHYQRVHQRYHPNGLVAKWPGPRSAASAAPGTPPHLPGDPGMEQMASMGVLWDLTDLIVFFFEWGVNVTFIFSIFMGS